MIINPVTNKPATLDEIADGMSVLPLKVGSNENDKTIEVIVCDSINGGNRYENNMPQSLTLLRVLENGTEYRGTYILEIEQCDPDCH